MHATAIGCQLLHSGAHNQSMCSRECGHQLCSHKGHIRDTWGDRELLAGLSSPALAAPPGPPPARKSGLWDWIPTELGGTASLPGASLLYLRYLLCAVLSRSVVSDSLQPHGLLPDSSVHGDSPGKNTGVGCHALLQGIFLTQGSNPGQCLIGFFTI